MEPAEGKVRLRLILGKAQVLSVLTGTPGMKLVLSLGNAVTMTVDMPVTADVRVGDLLTLYTEVLADAQPSAAPEQPVH